MLHCTRTMSSFLLAGIVFLSDIPSPVESALKWLENKKFLCRCLECPYCENGCAIQWFGTDCQYRDIAPRSHWNAITRPLVDGNIHTCMLNKRRKSVRLKWSGNRYLFTFLTAVFSNASNMDLLDVQFSKENVSKAPYIPCANKRRVRIRKLVLNIYCDVQEMIKQVYLTGAGVGHLCSVHVNAGRNIALKQMANISNPIYDPDIEANLTGSLAVDGDLRPYAFFYSCARSSPTETPWLNITFERPCRITSFILTGLVGELWSVMGYHFLAYSVNDTVLYEYTENRPQGKIYREIQVDKHYDPVIKASIKGQTRLSVCELEIYGDVVCPVGRWGLECEHTCNCLGYECFPDTGTCKDGCPPGFEGLGCSFECTKGWYGNKCLERCPTQCLRNICEPVTGICYGCKLGFAGLRCEKEIDLRDAEKDTFTPPCGNCKGEACEPNNECSFGCNPGFLGDACVTLCPYGFYGQNCYAQCPATCSHGYCNNIIGVCTGGCINGYIGEKCDTTCSDNTYGKDCIYTCSVTCASSLESKTNFSNQECNVSNGDCLFGCQEGYEGGHCSQTVQTVETDDQFGTSGILFAIISFMGLLFFTLCTKKRGKRPIVQDDNVSDSEIDQDYLS